MPALSPIAQILEMIGSQLVQPAGDVVPFPGASGPNAGPIRGSLAVDPAAPVVGGLFPGMIRSPDNAKYMWQLQQQRNGKWPPPR